MALWLIYSCDGGGSDKTTSHNGTCSTGSCNELEQGEVKQVEVAGCGGWVKLDCDGGCINILKVLNSPSLCAKHAGPKGPNAESAGAVTGIRCLPIGWDGGHSWTVFSGQNQDFMGPKNIHTWAQSKNAYCFLELGAHLVCYCIVSYDVLCYLCYIAFHESWMHRIALLGSVRGLSVPRCLWYCISFNCIVYFPFWHIYCHRKAKRFISTVYADVKSYDLHECQLNKSGIDS